MKIIINIYTYDAAGNKLGKTTVDNTTTPSQTTTTLYIGGAVYENDQLQFIGHEEGRIRPVRDGSGNITSFTYDYFLKDHLGNVRMVLTEEQKTDIYPAATLESTTYNGNTAISVEDDYYNITTVNVVPKSVATGIPAYQNNNGITNNNPYSNTTANSASLYRLDATTNTVPNKIGLGIALKVMAGDEISLFGKSYHKMPSGGYTASTNSLIVSDIINLFVGSSVLNGKGITSTQITGQSGFPGTIAGLLNNPPGQTSTTPRAGINWVILDEQFRWVSGGFDMVGSATGTAGTFKSHAITGITVPKNGYIYIFCSNESKYSVFFDNLQVVHNRGPILEETHYYPFGLTMAGISSKALNGAPENKKKFIGQLLDDDLALNWYQFRFRNHDPQIGRFWQIDPLAAQYVHNSTYAYAENDVIRAIDLEGLEKYIVTFQAFIPQEKVRNPDPTRNDKHFAGDNRHEYQVNSSSYRTSQSVNVDFDNAKMSLRQNYAASTTGLDKNGQPLTSSTPGKAGIVKGNVDAFEKGAGEAFIKFDTHAKNKLVSLAPAIDGIIDFTIIPNEDGSFNYSVKGQTDGFPAFELWVTDDKGNSYLLFNRNPIESGETIISLFPPMEHKYNYRGSSKNATKGPVVKFSETKNTKEEDER